MRAAPPPAARATPLGRRWTKERDVEDAVPYRAGGKRTACRVIYCEIIPRPGGGWRNAVGLAKTVTAGRRGRRPLQGGCAAITPAVIPRRAGVGPRHYKWVRRFQLTSFPRRPCLDIRRAPGYNSFKFFN